MADDPINRLDAEGSTRSTARGDVPERLRRRYLTDERRGPGLGFYVDATTTAPAFRDQGRRLSTERNDPTVVRDLVAIARHRGWTTVDVRGQSDFRREVWLQARAQGLEVRGYQPNARDRQDLARRLERARPRGDGAPARPHDLTAPGAEGRLRIVEAVVRHRIVEPAVQAQVLAAARARLANWLERGAQFAEVRARPDRAERGRDR